MRVALDYTPAISQHAGVGRYTRSLVDALVAEVNGEWEWLLWASAEHAAGGLVPPCANVQFRTLPHRSRWLNLIWHRIGVPVRLERYSGQVSVVHGTDFVVPPSSAPSVVTIHDLSFITHPELAFPRLRKYLATAVPRSVDRARRIIAVSDATRNDICDYFEIAPHRVEVIHHAADPMFSTPASMEIMGAQAQFGLRRPYFIALGTIEPRKDHKTLLRAFEQVNDAYPEVSLVIVGRRGWLADDIMDSIDQASRTRPVFHLQHVRDDMLPALIGGSVALVYPSRYEGFGLPVLEAMACGTAVVASDIPVLHEVAGDAALFAAVRSPEAFAEAMLQVLENDEKRQNLLERGREQVGRFSWRETARKHAEVYREVSSG